MALALTPLKIYKVTEANALPTLSDRCAARIRRAFSIHARSALSDRKVGSFGAGLDLPPRESSHAETGHLAIAW